MKYALILLGLAVLVAVISAEGEIWEEDDKEVLIRSERATYSNTNREKGRKHRKATARKGNPQNACRYVKGPWSDCDPKTNKRSRNLTLKKGDQNVCEPSKTIQKDCKKACRYEKGNWGPCEVTGQMVRVDTLKANSDPSCEQSRQISRKCKNKAGKGKENCKYERPNSVAWGPCNEATGVVSKTLRLIDGDKTVCPTERISHKKCVAVERRTKTGGAAGARRNKQPGQ